MLRTGSYVARWMALVMGALMLAVGGMAMAAQRGPLPAFAGVEPLAQVLLDPQVHAVLGLSAEQEAQWTTLHYAVGTLRSNAEGLAVNLRSLAAAEFADATPDLATVEMARVAAQQNMIAAEAAVSSEAVSLYSTLSTGQQAIVITVLRARPGPGQP